MGMSKSTALRRVKIMIDTLKRTSSTCDFIFANDVDNFLEELEELEKEVGKMVDQIMSNRYRNYNVKRSYELREQAIPRTVQSAL